MAFTLASGLQHPQHADLGLGPLPDGRSIAVLDQARIA
jgi:hypothetical protein